MRIVFSFGCNDSHLVDGAPRVAVAQTLKNARAMLTGARALAPVLMVGPPPVADPGVCARTEALNAALLALCARLQIPFIDVFRPLVAGALWQAEAAAWDGAHPSRWPTWYPPTRPGGASQSSRNSVRAGLTRKEPSRISAPPIYPPERRFGRDPF